MTTAYVCHLFLMCLYITVTHTLPAPANLTIVSHNFRHVLQWNPGIASPPRTVFNLRQRCSNGNTTVRLNITNTTVDVSDIEDIYSTCTFSVWASLDNTTSARVRKKITPYEDTIIGPPVISLSGCENCLNISISLPAGTSITDQMDQFYKSGTFNISWKKAGQSEAELISTSKNQQNVVLQNLRPGEQYCVRVTPQINSNTNTRASAWQCEYTSKEEPSGGLYLISWSLGSSVSGVAVLLLALSLLYTGSLCKMKSTPPSSLNKIVPEVHYLIPEEAFCERVCSTEARLNTACPSKPSNTLSAEDSGNKQHEENYANKADTEDEEDYEEEEEGKYMGCVIDDSGSSTETNKSKEKALPGRSQHFTGEPAIEDELISDVLEDRNRHKNPGPESKGNEDASGDISLFSVTLRTLGPQDNDEVCKPLLLDSVLGLSTSDDSVLEEHTEEEEEEEEEELRSGVEVHSPSGYMVTHTGDTSELKWSSSEESDCDTDYITR